MAINMRSPAIGIKIGPFGLTFPEGSRRPGDRDRLGLVALPMRGIHPVSRPPRHRSQTFRHTDGPAISAAKASIGTASAYRYEHDPELPSAHKQPRGRRRPDPLVDFLDAEVVPMLIAAPGLRSVAIFDEMQRRHPDLSAGARRTLERRIRSWRAVHGAESGGHLPLGP